MKSYDGQLYGLALELTTSSESDGTTCFCIDDGQVYVSLAGIWYEQVGSYWCVGGKGDDDITGLTQSMPASPSDLDKFNAVDTGFRYVGWGGHWFKQPIPWSDDAVILAAEAQPLSDLGAEDVAYDETTTYSDGSVGAIIQDTIDDLTELELQVSALDAGDIAYDPDETYSEDTVGEALSNALSEISYLDSIIQVTVKNLIIKSDIKTNVGFYRPTGSYSDNNSYCCSNKLFIRGCKKLYITGYYGSSVSPAVFYGSDEAYISGFEADKGSSTLYTYEITVPSNAYYVIVSSNAGDKINSFKCDAVFDKAKTNDKCFVATNGQDTNDGTSESTPVKTLIRAKALLADYGTLILKSGDYVGSDIGIDFDSFPNILGIDHPRILGYSQKFDSAELVSGYTKVYKAQNMKANTAGNYFCLYQHDIPDEATEIPASEAHPLNRNKLYRLPSTRIYHASSIAEIESTDDKYMWFLDDGYYYFSCPRPDLLSTNPVVIPSFTSGFYGTSDLSVSDISYSNFAILYNMLSVSRCAGTLDNIEIGMCAGNAGLSCDYCESILVRNCNIYAVSSSSAGDAINIHNDDSSVGRRSLVTIENCWIHDCSDDGESCHGNSNSIHYGTLVEYNGTGITPAGGGTVCHDVIARHHGAHDWVADTEVCAGFSCQGDDSTLVCHNCVSEQNNRGYYAKETTDSAQTAMTLINSISKNNQESELQVSKCEIETYDVTIINSDASKHIVLNNDGAVNVRGVDKGYDSDGVYVKTSAGKNYIVTNE